MQSDITAARVLCSQRALISGTGFIDLIPGQEYVAAQFLLLSAVVRSQDLIKLSVCRV